MLLTRQKLWKRVGKNWTKSRRKYTRSVTDFDFILVHVLILLQRFNPQFLLMRLRHATTAQDDDSEALASAFVQSSSADPPQASLPGSGTGTPGGREVDEFIKDFKALRKTYHKRVIWGDRWTAGQVTWRDD